MKKGKKKEFPTVDELQRELHREKYKNRYRKVFGNTIYTLLIAAAAAVLAAVLFLPVLRIYGHSMRPSLDAGDIVVSVKTSDYKKGDIAAFYYNNKVLVKRVIASSGDWVDIKENGDVYVNGEKLDEPYVSEKAFGECNIELPYQVPDEKLFLMGDHRLVSVDSRNTAVGCVSEEQMVGKLLFRVWPLDKFGMIR